MDYGSIGEREGPEEPVRLLCRQNRLLQKERKAVTSRYSCLGRSYVGTGNNVHTGGWPRDTIWWD